MASTEPTSVFFSDCYSLMLLAAVPAASPDDSTNDLKIQFVALKYNQKRIRLHTETKADVKTHHTHTPKPAHIHNYVCLYGCLVFRILLMAFGHKHSSSQVCMCAYVYICVYLYICMDAYTYTYAWTFVQNIIKCKGTCLHAHMDEHMFINGTRHSCVFILRSKQ